MRTIKELLEIVLKELVDKKYMDKHRPYSCLCNITSDLTLSNIITLDEKGYIDGYITDNRPDRHRLVFYWDEGDMEVRKEWLTNQI